MIESIIRGFLGFIQSIVNLVFGPIFALINPLLESLGVDTYFTLFNNIFVTYVYPSVTFFCQFIPPRTLGVIGLELVFTIGFFSISFVVSGVARVLRLIKKLPLA